MRPVCRNVVFGALLVVSSISFSAGGADSWTSHGPEGGFMLALAIAPSTPATLYAGAYLKGGVFKSTNSGENWTAVNTGLTDRNVYALAVDPLTSATVYAVAGAGVFKSTTGGEKDQRQ